MINVATKIVTSFKNNQVLSSLLENIVKTRWSSHLALLKSLLNTKSALKTLAIDEKAEHLASDVKSNLLEDSCWDPFETSGMYLRADL